MWKIDDEVILTTNKYTPGISNPVHTEYPDVTGKVYEIRDNGYGNGNPVIRVKWSTGRKNSYVPKDLSHASGYYKHKSKLMI